MIKEIDIQNYKVFRDISLRGFGQINLIGGMNNMGKTTLLEAIFNFYDRLNREVMLRPFVWRSGIPLVNLTHDVWIPVFHNYDNTNTISVTIKTENGKTGELSLSFDKTFNPQNKGGISEIPTLPADNASNEAKPVLKLLFTEDGKIIQETYLYFSGMKLNSIHKIAEEKSLMPAQYISSKLINASSEAIAFGEMLRNNVENVAIEALRLIEPGLKSIIPVPIADNLTVLYGDIGLKSKIPLYNMGDGISRMLAYINAIVKNKDGVVLIDEIENGFHYAVHSHLWRIFLNLAKQFKVQIFATTHSLEMVQAFNKISRETDDYLFSYTELFRDRKNEKINSNVMDSKTLQYKLQANKPFRGE